MRSPREFENPLCAQVDGDIWFPEKGNDAKDAKAICARCSHRTECAEWGIRHEAHGIWGGLNGRDRQLIRRKLNIILDQPSVEEWLGNAQPRKSLE
jgi:WhiB family redox-sensing transcriptional regulator